VPRAARLRVGNSIAFVATYEFLTTWLVDADPVDVWNAIYEVENWPEWWKGVREVVKLDDGDDHGVGMVFLNRWRSVLPYTVEFTARTTTIEQPRLIEIAADGELAGEGRWRLFSGASVAVTYEWRVRTTKSWMNALSPIGRPVFAWNHHAIMRQGGEGLARRVGGRLLARS
jgi:Polyketide cyclase / dehydrase and lipid transport